MRVVILIPLACIVMGLASCPAYVEAIYEEKLAEWREANPDAELTPEIEAGLRKEAEIQAAKETERVLSGGGAAVGGFATGNYIGGALGIITLIGLGLGIKKRMSAKKGGK